MSSEHNDQRGTDRIYVPGDVPEVSSLSKALDEIIQDGDVRTKRAAKRKHGGTQAPGSAAVAKDSEKSESEGQLVAREPLLHSARVREVGRTMRHGLATSLFLKDNPDVRNFEAFGGAITMANADNPASYKRITENVLDRNLRANGGQFREMAMVFMPSRSNLASRQQHLLPANVVRRIENEATEQNSTPAWLAPPAAAPGRNPNNGSSRGRRNRRRGRGGRPVAGASASASASTPGGATAATTTAAATGQPSPGPVDVGDDRAYKRKKALQELDDDMDQYWAEGGGQGNSTS
ncbi:hypothetical protein M434DRAFT_18247 [Hypoxylon sp. CO27-5]|nr:hypothetical protein M434DRAFT_18247 [Hypoxylon sp. CO27-5]